MLRLGKDLDRCYSMRIPFLDGFYKVDIFFNKNNTFLLFGADQNVSKQQSITLKTFKNLKAAKFADLFLELYDFQNDRLDIINQYRNIKEEYISDIHNVLNENIVLSKYVDDNDKILYDCIIIYGFNFISYPKDFIFIIAERQSISAKLQKKFVRSTAIQIGTLKSLELMKSYEVHKEELFLKPLITDPNKIITL